MSRLLILMPRYTMVEGTLVDEVFKIVGGFRDYVYIGGLDHNLAFHNLNLGIQKGLSMPTAAWDRLVILEQDHRYPKDVLDRVSRLEEPIVGAPYWKRTERDLGVMVPGWWRNGELVPLSKREYAEMKAKERPAFSNLHPIDVVGTCLLSIDRRVLADWPRDEPWFWPQYQGRKLIGYETRFCLTARQLGYVVMLDTWLEIDHYARLPVREGR
jgi:hypothetical protein